MIAAVLPEAHALGGSAGLLALLNVILIDVVLSGDNAIVIGMATRQLQGRLRQRAIAMGIAAATVLRVLFAAVAVHLLKVIGLKLAGGVLLLYVVWKFYRELRQEKQNGGEHAVRSPPSLWNAVGLILIADVSMSLDNVLAVAGAARESMLVLAIGLLFSIILMAVASNYIAKQLDRYPHIQWAGLLVILFVAMEMVMSGAHELEKDVLRMRLLPPVLFVLAGIGIVLHQRYIPPVKAEAAAIWFLRRRAGFFFALALLSSAGMVFRAELMRFLKTHPEWFYFLGVLALFLTLETLALLGLHRAHFSKGRK